MLDFASPIVLTSPDTVEEVTNRLEEEMVSFKSIERLNPFREKLFLGERKDGVFHIRPSMAGPFSTAARDLQFTLESFKGGSRLKGAFKLQSVHKTMWATLVSLISSGFAVYVVDAPAYYRPIPLVPLAEKYTMAIILSFVYLPLIVWQGTREEDRLIELLKALLEERLSPTGGYQAASGSRIKPPQPNP